MEISSVDVWSHWAAAFSVTSGSRPDIAYGRMFQTRVPRGRLSHLPMFGAKTHLHGAAAAIPFHRWHSPSCSCLLQRCLSSLVCICFTLRCCMLLRTVRHGRCSHPNSVFDGQV